MVLDSPYPFGTLILTRRAGIAAGLAAAMLMLTLIAALQSVSGLELAGMLVQTGRIILPARVFLANTDSLLFAGLGLHASLGMLFGLLYAVCQQRVPTRGLISVGLFYGFMLWVLSRLIVRLITYNALHAWVRGWPWLLACLLYGGCMAVFAMWSERRRPVALAATVPMD